MLIQMLLLLVKPLLLPLLMLKLLLIRMLLLLTLLLQLMLLLSLSLLLPDLLLRLQRTLDESFHWLRMMLLHTRIKDGSAIFRRMLRLLLLQLRQLPKLHVSLL